MILYSWTWSEMGLFVLHTRNVLFYILAIPMIFFFNRIFFDACDGIFLNYIWSEAHLMRSVGAAGRDRQSDVYVGVDVFGRGCFGGGGYNSKAVRLLIIGIVSAQIDYFTITCRLNYFIFLLIAM